MKRTFLSLSLALMAWSGALASTSAAASSSSASVSGRVTAYDGSSLTIQTSGPQSGVINALTAAAQTITREDFPYVYGGGHGQAGIASVGVKGPGYNGRRRGFDCSGAVAAVLAGAGLWPAGTGVPNDAGIITQLRNEGLIVPGPGTGAEEVTLYDRPGVHIFMNIDGRFFGTSDGRNGNASQQRRGAGWLNDGAPDTIKALFKRYHLVSSVLRTSGGAGHSLTLRVGTVTGSTRHFAVGEKVTVAYRETGVGGMFALSITLLGATSLGVP